MSFNHSGLLSPLMLSPNLFNSTTKQNILFGNTYFYAYFHRNYKVLTIYSSHFLIYHHLYHQRRVLNTLAAIIALKQISNNPVIVEVVLWYFYPTI